LIPFKEKYQKSIQEIKRKKVPYNYHFDIPYIFISLKVIGLPIRPPYYNDYKTNTIIISLWGSIHLFLVTKFLLRWPFAEIPFGFLFCTIVIIPIALGLLMAFLYEKRKLKYDLSNWENL